jgi:hypothetical protein
MRLVPAIAPRQFTPNIRDSALRYNSRVAIMALPLPPGLTPPEIAFLCEMELVTVIPRQRLEGLELLGVCMPRQHPPPDVPRRWYTQHVQAEN